MREREQNGKRDPGCGIGLRDRDPLSASQIPRVRKFPATCSRSRFGIRLRKPRHKILPMLSVMQGDEFRILAQSRQVR